MDSKTYGIGLTEDQMEQLRDTAVQRLLWCLNSPERSEAREGELALRTLSFILGMEVE